MSHPGSPDQPHAGAPATPGVGAQPGYAPAPGYGSPPPGYGPPPGYAGFPPAAPYGGPAPWPTQMPPDRHIGWAIASLVLFWPLCIPAFIASMKVSDLWFTGRYQEAVQASADAKRWGKLGVIIGACGFGAMILFYVVMIIVVVTQSSSMQ